MAHATGNVRNAFVELVKGGGRQGGNAIPYYRTLDAIMDAGLWPDQGLCPDTEASTRHFAIFEVLRRIPPDDFSVLSKLADTFHWYIPEYWCGGEVMPFTVTNETGEQLDDHGELFTVPTARVLYLSPALERRALDTVVALVAHELAHVVAAHKLYNRPDEYQRQEAEADAKVCAWGFESENRKRIATNKRRETLMSRPVPMAV